MLFFGGSVCVVICLNNYIIYAATNIFYIEYLYMNLYEPTMGQIELKYYNRNE